MKKGDIVRFNSMVPLYLLKKFDAETYTVNHIGEDGWVSLLEDTGKHKKMIHRNWLEVIKEA
jgi:hypothetical protein